jgi:hypothetical protein
MSLTDQDIKDFIEAWFDEFAERLSPDAARHEATLLLDLYTLLLEYDDTSHDDVSDRGPT